MPSIPIGDIDRPHMLRVPVVDGVLDIYTGWATFVVNGADRVTRESVVSLVPTSGYSGTKYGVQEYPETASVKPIITASLTSFSGIEVAAVDNASVYLNTVSFQQGSNGLWLNMLANIACANGAVYRFAYQVTVHVTGIRDNIVGMLDGMHHSLDPSTRPEQTVLWA
jgi:hypothetical protein